MFKKLLQFEWHCHTRTLLFYATLVSLFLLGFMVTKGNFSFANTNHNSPYIISYLIGMMSLILIFSMTVLVAQTQLKDSETKFDSIVYATPVSKFKYLSARFLVIYAISFLSFLMLVLGVLIGHLFPSEVQQMGPFSIVNYIVPTLLFVVPNVFLIASILMALTWLTRSKLMIYVGGLFIYILYVMGSVFSNSPIFAGASPATPEAMSLMAKLDPFGLAAFFEQTRYWTVFQKNNQLFSLSGNFLFNRSLWMGISLIILSVSYRLFSFRNLREKPGKSASKNQKEIWVLGVFLSANFEFQTFRHNFEVLKSFIIIDLRQIIKGIPFVLINIMLTGLLAVEISDEIDGGRRMAESIATTGLMITTLMDRSPIILILIMLFYSSELLWRSESVRFSQLENVTPHYPIMAFFSKWITLSIVPFLLILLGICIGVSFQLLKGNAPVEITLYLSLFYFLGLPMVLIAVLVLSVQTMIQSRYVGLVIASITIILVSTSIGQMVGVTYPLFRFADTLKVEYFDMNGFGQYTFSFLIKIFYATGLSLVLLFLSSIFWKRNGSIRTVFKNQPITFFQKTVLITGSLLLMGFGSYTFYEINIKNQYLTANEQFDWQQHYEEKYRPFQNFDQPTITSVKTKVDLFPSENRYEVKGTYQLTNNSDKPIDSLLLYVDENIQLQSVAIERAKRITNDAEYGHFWYRMTSPLQPKEHITMTFSFVSSWSSFTGHTGFNSIIDNGSFMRISRYYPGFGYQSGNEITNSKERKSRKMQGETPIRKLEDQEIQPYDFIDFEAVVSTSKDQKAIGVGDLVKEWESNGRNYFQYKTSGKIPFRFAFSSARYDVKKEQYKGISIEVYYDKRHSRNINELISATKRTLDYCQMNFGPYPYKTIRYAEISAFAEGFAATAYPSTLYMKENFGFYSDITKGDKEDVINQLAGHELSHQWWGNGQFNPEEKEGGWILTETLAQYTEIMLYERHHGWNRALETLRMHQDLYLSSRSFETEMPLYKTHYDTPHLPYNKGAVVMHQLRMLIGETNINKALRSLMTKYAFPNKPADTRDFLNEIYKVSPSDLHGKIDELFKQIVTYSAKVDSVSSKKAANGKYEVTFEISTKKFREDGKGKQTFIPNDSTIDIGIYDMNGKLHIQSYPTQNNKVNGKMTLSVEPELLEIDPNLKIMDTFLEDNSKEISKKE